EHTADLPMVLPRFHYIVGSPRITRSYEGDVEVNGRLCHQLLVKEEGEEDQLMYIDGETFLVTRIDTRESGMDITLTMSDFREAGGTVIPYMIIQAIGFIKAPPAEMTLIEVRWNESIPLSTFSPPAGQVEDHRFTDGDSAEVPIRLLDGHIFLEVRLNDSPSLNFLLDSGAGRTIVAAHTADACGLKLGHAAQAMGVGGEQTINAIEVASLRLEGLELLNQKVFAMDLSELTPAFGERVDGVIGYDLFTRFVVKIDYAAQLVSVIPSSRFTYDGPGTVLPAELTMNMMHIPCTIEGHAGSLRVDTGSNGSLHLHAPFVLEFGLHQDDRRRLQVRALGVGGKSELYTSRIGELTIGPYRFTNLLGEMASDTGNALSVSNSLATVGAQILSKFTVYFDYPGNRLILEPNKNFDDPIPFNRAGLSLVMENGRPVIRDIVPESPAAGVDILPGDILLAIDGTDGDNLGLFGVRALMRGDPGTRLKFRLEREGKKIKRKLVLADYI
ncbi:aspartyl protease family protein, partial [bacterium]|nr:aspartyl protease family protein [candidate division CSSED10-310 bacterium]